jgi:hypothetical protein
VPNARFRLECHGAGSPYGAKTRFWINETLVVETTTNIPNASQMGFWCGAVNTTPGGGTVSIALGPVGVTWNRYPSLPAL